MQFIKRKLSGKPTGPYCIAQGTLLNAVAAWIGREFGGEWTHVYVWLSPLTVRLKLPQHC